MPIDIAKVIKKKYDMGILILRLAIGVLMLLHGIAKVQHGISPIEEMVVGSGLPAMFAYGVYIGEIVAPILIILGIATRLSAAIFAINCITAAILAHSQDFFSLNATGGWTLELLGLYFFISLSLIFMGGGKYTLTNKYLWD